MTDSANLPARLVADYCSATKRWEARWPSGVKVIYKQLLASFALAEPTAKEALALHGAVVVGLKQDNSYEVIEEAVSERPGDLSGIGDRLIDLKDLLDLKELLFSPMEADAPMMRYFKELDGLTHYDEIGQTDKNNPMSIVYKRPESTWTYFKSRNHVIDLRRAPERIYLSYESYLNYVARKWNRNEVAIAYRECPELALAQKLHSDDLRQSALIKAVVQAVATIDIDHEFSSRLEIRNLR